MSEHIGVKGKVDFYHLPYREENGFTACRRCCKEGDFTDKLLIEFHEGFGSDWMQVICGNCKKTIWVANLNGRRKQIKDDKKCYVCKNPTNHYDSVSHTFSKGLPKSGAYVCSEKCNKKLDKILDKILPKPSQRTGRTK